MVTLHSSGTISIPKKKNHLRICFLPKKLHTKYIGHKSLSPDSNIESQDIILLK